MAASALKEEGSDINFSVRIVNVKSSVPVLITRSCGELLSRYIEWPLLLRL